MKSALIVAAMSVAAMAAPVVAQDLGGYPPAYAALPSPGMVAPPFYSAQTPFGMYTGTTTQFRDMTIYNTTAPDGTTTTTCVQSYSGGSSFVNCF